MRKLLILIIMITGLSVIAEDPNQFIGIGDNIVSEGKTSITLSAVILHRRATPEYFIEQDNGTGKIKTFQSTGDGSIFYLNTDNGKYMIIIKGFDPNTGIVTFNLFRYGRFKRSDVAKQ